MPEKRTLARARKDRREGKSPSTQAGEFVREEIHHVREGKHGARSTKQAIAIGLSKARRAGVALPGRGRSSVGKKTRRIRAPKTSPTRAKASDKALEREPRRAASHEALSRHAKKTAPQATATRRRRKKT